ncbi:hypothetical protein BG004_004465 [Podila humilis]|nr:hypothetical protein BG004_004465 [Podila humilis]
MLDNLSDGLTKSPLLPVVLNYIPPELIKTSKTAIFKAPTRVPEKTGCIVLTEDDGIDVEMEVQDTVSRFNLNQDQATVLRNFALTVVRAPSWGSKSQEPPPPILLVHAVLIIFADTIISKARPVAPEERSCRFLVASMTNVAVDRVLTALLDLGYTDFVRVGSLKKVARRILPYTAQSNAREDVKELQLILQEDNLTPSERHNVRVAIKRFQKDSNRDIVDGAKVVGATCVASTFEALDNMSFPIVILDEASQLLEPMSLVPLCRAAGEKLIMVGDPLQLSPPVTTKVDNLSANTGYTRTLFDRAVELKAGMSPQDRAPLVSGLPTLSFIDNNGSEIQNQRSKSFTNPAEVRLVVDIVQRLLSLNVSSSDIGVISLYKSQAEAIQSSLEELTKVSGLNGGGVQISTVDAFQGSEKEVIIVSTVRTESIGFIDNRQRVNVALSRSKRHLFLVGNSRLLSSNQLWGQIINTHCAESIDGVTRGDHFLSHLKTLVPIPKTPAPGLLEDSDTEDEDELPRPNGTVHETEHYSDKEGSEEEVYPEPPLRTGSRKYTLYLADETDSDNSHEEERLSRQSRSNGKPRHVSHSSEGQWQHPSTQADPNVLNVAMRRPEDIVMASASPPFVRQHITESASSMLNCESVGRPELTANLRKPVQIIYIPAVAAQEPVDQSHEVEELNQKETVVWEMTEDDYEAFDEAMIRDEDAVPDATENTLKDDLAPIVTASRSHISSLSPPLAPAANVRAQPQPSLGAMDSESVIDCCESQRLEDLEDLFSLTQTHVAPNHVTSTNTRLSTCLVDTVESTASLREVSTGLSLEQTDSHETERDTAGVRIEQGEEQDLALLMNDFE